MDTNGALVLFLTVFGILGVWFLRCDRAQQSRQVRSFAQRTLRYAGGTFVVGLAFLTSDFGAGTEPSIARMALLAITVGSFLLLYAAAWALTAADDESLEWVNLTGRALLLTGQPDLAPFYALPARGSVAATVLPPVRRRTHYVVDAGLGRIGAKAGRGDLFIAEANSSAGRNETGPMLVQRLIPATAIGAPPVEESSQAASIDRRRCTVPTVRIRPYNRPDETRQVESARDRPRPVHGPTSCAPRIDRGNAGQR